MIVTGIITGAVIAWLFHLKIWEMEKTIEQRAKENGISTAFAADAETCTGAGLSKREYFTASIIQGLVSKYHLNNASDQTIIAKMAVELADELLLQLESK